MQDKKKYCCQPTEINPPADPDQQPTNISQYIQAWSVVKQHMPLAIGDGECKQYDCFLGGCIV